MGVEPFFQRFNLGKSAQPRFLADFVQHGQEKYQPWAVHNGV
jgi:hypothetical protein